jgi:hypothetical protein
VGMSGGDEDALLELHGLDARAGFARRGGSSEEVESEEEGGEAEDGAPAAPLAGGGSGGMRKKTRKDRARWAGCAVPALLLQQQVILTLLGLLVGNWQLVPCMCLSHTVMAN